MRVLITRAEPSASRTAELFKTAGHEAVKLPLFEVHDTCKEIPQEAFDGYIFTSSNACAILENRGWKPQNPATPVYCVGKKTTESARNLGFSNIIYEEGGAQRLSTKIVTADLPNNARILYFTTPDRSFDLKTHLATHKLDVINLEIYQAATKTVDFAEIRQIFMQKPPQAVLCYSKRSADVLAKHIDGSEITNELSQIDLIAISPNAVGALAAFKWKQTHIAAVANEQAMLHILD